MLFRRPLEFGPQLLSDSASLERRLLRLLKAPRDLLFIFLLTYIVVRTLPLEFLCDIAHINIVL